MKQLGVWFLPKEQLNDNSIIHLTQTLTLGNSKGIGCAKGVLILRSHILLSMICSSCNMNNFKPFKEKITTARKNRIIAQNVLDHNCSRVRLQLVHWAHKGRSDSGWGFLGTTNRKDALAKSQAGGAISLYWSVQRLAWCIFETSRVDHWY